MKKRRRAYKRFDWKEHKAALLRMRYERCMEEVMNKMINTALLYGMDEANKKKEKFMNEAALRWFDKKKQVTDILKACRE